ncbi:MULTISPECIES: transporter substrate-binding domain-containing protein [unclassified Pseudomonas]|uniref:transporter substrate-binding domain-containing protein n=1 Tax=unclassified Pseudomonas TaxID=196821 RepID=UPI002555D613|nr:MULTISPECIES: transporter substrate-binding domain-containing protein [unclassified Pseudomonas]
MILTRLMLALALCTMTGVLCSTAYAKEKRSQVIRFGVEPLVPPFESRNAKGELVGLNIELGNALCAQLKRRCEWVDQSYATNLAALEAGRFDAIMPMSSTPARRKQIDFTDNLYPLETRLVARRDLALQPDLKVLQGRRIGVLAGTSREAYALARWAPHGVEVKTFKLNAQLIESLRKGEIDATLQDSIEISQALLKTAQGVDFAFAGPAIKDEMLGTGVAIGLRKTDPELRDALNQALQRLKDNGQHAAITGRYLAAAPAPQRPVLQPLGFSPADAGLPFSQTVRAGSLLFLSGLLGLDSAGKRVPGGIEAETARALESMRTILKDKGLSMERVVKCTVILADINDFAAMNKVYSRYFPANHLPARTAFAAGRLLLDARIEIECVASY